MLYLVTARSGYMSTHLMIIGAASNEAATEAAEAAMPPNHAIESVSPLTGGVRGKLLALFGGKAKVIWEDHYDHPY